MAYEGYDYAKNIFANILPQDLSQVQKALDEATQKQDQKRGVVGDAAQNVPVAGQAVNGLTDTVDGLASNVPVVGGVVNSVVKRGVVGDTAQNVPVAGGLVNGLTDTVDGLASNVPVAGDVVNSVVKRDGAVTGQVDSLVNTLEGTVKDVPAVGPTVGGALGSLTKTVEGALAPVTSNLPIKREDPVSQLAGNLLPQLNSLGVLPQGVGLQQLTGLLNTLNAKGLIGNLEQVLGGLLNGGLLKGLLKRDDEISQLASNLLPELLQNNILSNVGVDQLSTLLNTLSANGLLTNVQSLLGGLL